MNTMYDVVPDFLIGGAVAVALFLCGGSVLSVNGEIKFPLKEAIIPQELEIECDDSVLPDET